MLHISLFSALLGVIWPVPQQQESGLTLDNLFELEERLRPDPGVHLGWLEDGAEFLAHGEGESPYVAVDVTTLEERPFFDVERMRRAWAALPGITPELAAEWSGRTDHTFSPHSDAVLIEHANDLFYYRLGSESALRLTSDPLEEVGETFSPDGRWLSFVRDFDLFVVDTEGGQPRALTAGGNEDLLFGRLDWVYQEELYGRGNFQAHWWSPDSHRIALLVLDESPVPEYTIVDHEKVRPDVEVWHYPKAGDPNPGVALAALDVAGGELTYFDLERYQTRDFLITAVDWTPDGQHVVFMVQNRIQTWLDLVVGDPRTGETQRLFRDETGVWIEPKGGPYWIDGGERFLWISERDGFKHLYLYKCSGELERRLTEGEWEVDAFHGVDEQARAAWFSGDLADVKGSQLYRVSLDGEPELVRVTEGEGTHVVSMAPDLRHFVDRFSSTTIPPRVELRTSEGALVRELDVVDPALLESFGFIAPQFHTVETRDGFEMEALSIRPPDFDPGRKYPVMSYTYSGPHAPRVVDRFNSRHNLFHQLLAQSGYIVWMCDNRSASGRGLESVRGVYRNLGEQELADLEDGFDWLVGQGFVDPERIGLWGWSYGGYMTAYAMTHSQRFKMGISGAPVTDWHLYDSIYTERYMDMPQDNPEGYAASSVLHAAGELSGELLLIHGEIDENVHMQNSLQFARALQDAGKLFQFMIYPGNRHSVRSLEQKTHLYRTMLTFIREHL